MPLSRRDLLALAALPLAAQSRPQLGILVATTYTTGTLESRLDEAKAHGFECVQLGLSCAGLPDMPDEIPAHLPATFHAATKSRNLKFASIQALFNMAHPDPAHRQSGLRRLRLITEAFPNLPVHIATGTRNTQSMWRHHPDNRIPEAWRNMLATVREATRIAAATNSILAFEPEINNIADTARRSLRLLDEVASPHLKVTLDPANLFPTGTLPRMKEILTEAFELLGKDMVLAHAKDLDHDGDAGHKAAGEGLLDYNLYVSLLRKYNYTGPFLLHGLTKAQVPTSLAFLKSKLSDTSV